MKTQASLAAGVLAAIGATACCAGPLLLVMLGFGGAWASGLRSLAPLQPIFAVLTAFFVGWAFHRLYVRPRRCAPGEACEAPRVLRRQRAAFWRTRGPCGRDPERDARCAKAVTDAGYPASFRK